MRILLVDDDALLTQTLADFLTSQHYAVDVATDGEAGWNYAQAATYDLIVLDVNLPKLNGVYLCQRLRRNKYNNPILLLTAQGGSADKVMGLDAGADDYLVKSCTTEELSARIRALLRRQSPSAEPILAWGGLCIDLLACEVTYQKQTLTLSPKEYGLLELFLRNPQRVFSNSIILEHLWGFENAPGEETIRTHIKRLRQKLKAVGAENVIDTVYGMGYRLTPHSKIGNAAEPTVADQARAAAIALWDQFKPPIMERLVSLEQAIAALKTGNLSDAQRQTAAGEAHKLAGSLGMFGFPEGSRLGQLIEQWLRTETAPEGVEPLQTLVAALRQALQQPPQASESNLLTALSEESPGAASPAVETAPRSLPTSLGKGTVSKQQAKQPRSPDVKVLAVDDDALTLETLQQILPRWGICTVTLGNPLHLWDALEREMPDLLDRKSVV